jgi:hypothetical protein
MFFHELEKNLIFDNGDCRNEPKRHNSAVPLRKTARSDFTDDKGVHSQLTRPTNFGKFRLWLTEVVRPNRSIDNNHLETSFAAQVDSLAWSRPTRSEIR